MFHLDGRKTKLLAFLIALLILFLDQLTKFLALRYLSPGVPFRIIDNFVRFTLIRNPHTVFGISLGKHFPYEIAGILLIILLIFLILRENKPLILTLYGVILGGALGNTIDRLRLKHVIDFVDIGVTENIRWYIFNLADASISIALVCYIIFLLLEKKESKSVE